MLYHAVVTNKSQTLVAQVLQVQHTNIDFIFTCDFPYINFMQPCVQIHPHLFINRNLRLNVFLTQVLVSFNT
jgi:hypothetical protein